MQCTYLGMHAHMLRQACTYLDVAPIVFLLMIPGIIGGLIGFESDALGAMTDSFDATVSTVDSTVAEMATGLSEAATNVLYWMRHEEAALMIQHRYRARVKARKVISELNRTCALAEMELQIRFERKRRSKRKQQSRVKREESSRPVGARQAAFEWLQQEQDATLLQEKEDVVAGCPAYPMGALCAMPVAGKDHTRERSSRERGRHLRRSTSRLRDEDIGCEGGPSASRGASNDLPFVSQAILEPPAPQHHISHPGGWHCPRAQHDDGTSSCGAH